MTARAAVRLGLYALGLACVASSTACSDGYEPFDTDSDGSDDTDIYIDVTFTEHVQPKLSPCLGCHQGETPDGALDLTGDMYDKLMTLPSGQTDMALIEPGNANYSYIWHKINGSQVLAGGAGTRMPLGVAWSEDDIELLALWIDLGAKR